MTTTQQRKQLRTKVGTVTSASGSKTVRVELGYRIPDAKYGKFVRHRTVLHVHDERGEAKVGDKVQVAPCRPISKTKRWRLLKVLQRGVAPIAAELIPSLPEEQPPAGTPAAGQAPAEAQAV